MVQLKGNIASTQSLLTCLLLICYSHLLFTMASVKAWQSQLLYVEFMMGTFMYFIKEYIHAYVLLILAPLIIYYHVHLNPSMHYAKSCDPTDYVNPHDVRAKQEFLRSEISFLNGLLNLVYLAGTRET